VVVQILGDGFDRPRGCLDLPEGSEESLSSKRPHRRGARGQVTETIELARTHGEQTSKILQSHASRSTILKLPPGFLQLPQQETAPISVEIPGSVSPVEAHSGPMDRPMDSIMKFGQWTATAVEPGSTAIQDDELPGMPVQMVLNLQRAGNHEQRGDVLILDFETVRAIEAEQDHAPAPHLPQALILQLARSPLGS